MILHEWTSIDTTERHKHWQCQVCKVRVVRYRGLIESDESFHAPPPPDMKGGCNLQKRIDWLEAELKRCKEKLLLQDGERSVGEAGDTPPFGEAESRTKPSVE